MFKRAYAEKSGQNNLVSPLSVLLALSMTANGAGGATLSEMEAVLYGSGSITRFYRGAYGSGERISVSGLF